MLAILSTHPIQYQVPLWQALARNGTFPFEVWHFTHHGTHASFDREFGMTFAWDLNTLSGYPNRLLNIHPGTPANSFWKCRLHEDLGTRLRAAGARAVW